MRRPIRSKTPQGFYVNLGFQDPAEAERIYNALSKGGTVNMELQETFWAKKFGMFTDRFGTPWMINCEKRRLILRNDCEAAAFNAAAAPSK